ncbi:DHI1 dehydrogenase, partial [Fregetta grallaria]|nr:DHI1 dehydrogenase [Fregetta grallaria]
MGLLLKIFIPLLGLALAFYFYSAPENFSEEMLRGKRVIVTGASSGIGEQMAYHLARMEAHLLLTARTEAKLQKVNGKQSVLGTRNTFATQNPTGRQNADFHPGLGTQGCQIPYRSTPAFPQHEPVLTRTHPPPQQIAFSTLTAWSSAESEGSIVVVSSMAGKTGTPFTAPYSATKFALNGFFSSLRHEFIIDKVNVSITLCILGYINTENAVRTVSHAVRGTPAPKEECALEIIRSGALRQRELHYPSRVVGILLLLQGIAPDFLDSLIRSNYKVENIRR